MDFGTLLHVAKKNSQEGSDKTRCYSTKFAPPKKEARDKKLSANIQKFLQKKEEEDRAKEREKVRKRDELLAMRDTKSKNKISKMLKVIKSANKAVIADAVDNDNTAVTLQGPDQPDEDDYGYVSAEASAFYSKMMEKYKSQPEEDKFSSVRRRVTATEVKKVPRDVRDVPQTVHKRSDMPPPAAPKDASKEEKGKTKLKKPPPPVDFHSLLKIAEKKQFEPIEIVQEVKKKEPERPMTQKEKQEHEERLAILEAKKRRLLEAKTKGKMVKSPVASTSKATPPSISKKPDLTRDTREAKDSKSTAEKRIEKPIKKEVKVIKKPLKPAEPQKSREFPPKDVQKPREVPPKDVQKPREIPPKDVQKTREFPPRDVPRARPKPRLEPRRPPPKRPRIEDDDSEYDSEMDDFIDDGPEEGANSYSRHIQEIFGYDKSRYRDEDDDDKNMESTFAQQMREEFISKKIGIMEDLEDMRQEELEKQRKMSKKKRA
ncbi:protein SPT2 homolog [Phlebotomus argentipes]|uniref:protein SPT2 homolog n=1 Tax=Phlebotomus argentipes TaxID=94469 RepID=UPI0028935D56|nr:protein SPT2 homolog [Phlebotomus argentipes]